MLDLEFVEYVRLDKIPAGLACELIELDSQVAEESQWNGFLSCI
ncbi:hypothetical protein [Cryptosporangium sp. NPDC051539]